jgi:hypothetical protein
MVSVRRRPSNVLSAHGLRVILAAVGLGIIVSGGAGCPPITIPTCSTCTGVGQVDVCFVPDECFVPRAEFSPCSHDPCAPDGSGVCAGGLACIDVTLPSGPASFCLAGTGPGGACDSSNDRCAENFGTYFCPPDSCSGGSTCTGTVPAAAGASQGPCDGNFTDTTACLRCEPGTSCEPSSTTAGHLCRQNCRNSNDCIAERPTLPGGSCDDGRSCIALTDTPNEFPTVLTTSNSNGQCYHCQPNLGQACDLDMPCCTAGQACQFVKGNPPACCAQNGVPSMGIVGGVCSTAADCCQGPLGVQPQCTLAIDGQKRCLQCAPNGTVLTSRDETGACCSGFSAACSDGTQLCCEGVPTGSPCTPNQRCVPGSTCQDGTCQPAPPPPPTCSMSVCGGTSGLECCPDWYCESEPGETGQRCISCGGALTDCTMIPCCPGFDCIVHDDGTYCE